MPPEAFKMGEPCTKIAWVQETAVRITRVVCAEMARAQYTAARNPRLSCFPKGAQNVRSVLKDGPGLVYGGKNLISKLPPKEPRLGEGCTKDRTGPGYGGKDRQAKLPP